MNLIETKLPGVVIIEPRVFSDDRGFFLETFQDERYARLGSGAPFVQDNHSHSKQGVLRGLHYKVKKPEAKLVYAVTGEIWDVAADLRKGSPTFGQWVGVTLSAANRRQLFVPEGYAHGFCVISENADVLYKVTGRYDPADEAGVRWDDPALAIDWPVRTPLLSPKDAVLPNLAHARLPEADFQNET